MAQISLTNLTPNGSFETTTNWWLSGSRVTIPVALPTGEPGSNCLSLTSANTPLLLSLKTDNKYYARVLLLTTSVSTISSIIFSVGGLNISKSNPTQNTWYFVDNIVPVSSITGMNFGVSGTGNGCIDNIMIINLTDAYGAGNEPDLATIRQLVADNGNYWDGTKVINIGSGQIYTGGYFNTGSGVVRAGGYFNSGSGTVKVGGYFNDGSGAKLVMGNV